VGKIYDYECDVCHTVQEVWFMSQPEEKRPPRCRVCGADMHNRLPSAPGFQLKGDGWAKDGYSSSKGEK
jgi:putative FmdB family regulatory protein